MLKQSKVLNNSLLFVVFSVLASCIVAPKKVSTYVRIPCKSLVEMDSIFRVYSYFAVSFDSDRITLLSTYNCIDRINNNYETLDSFFRYIIKYDNIKEIQINDLTIDSFPSSIKNLQNIREISLINCNVKNINLFGCDSIKSFLYKNENKKKLNNIFNSLPKNVKEIYLENIEIDSLNENIGRYKNLRFLALIQCGKISYISNQFFSLDSLDILDIIQTSFPMTNDSIRSGFGDNHITIERH